MSDKFDIYKMVTDKIVAALDAGTVPWRKPWVNGTQMSVATRKPYRGINQFLLNMVAESAGYKRPWWLTFKQAQALGGVVRKGEHGTIVVFYKTIKKEVDGEEKSFRLLRYFRVFNVEQCDNLPADKFLAPVAAGADPVAEADALIHEWDDAPIFSHGSNGASYAPAIDTINMPYAETFESTASYYSTLFHECIHATGSKSRLDRDLSTTFASEKYSKEELTAELGAAMLCAITGIVDDRQIENSAAYIATWKSRLADDPKLIVQAASKAHAAADYIQGIKYDNAKVEATTEIAEADQG